MLVGLIKHAVHHHPQEESSSNSLVHHPQAYPVSAAVVWGLVMALFESNPKVLHKSLKQSMEEIYRYSFQEDDSAEENLTV